MPALSAIFKAPAATLYFAVLVLVYFVNYPFFGPAGKLAHQTPLLFV